MKITGSAKTFKSIFIVTILLMWAAIGLLVYEYGRMSMRAREFIEIREDYRNYVLAFKKVLDDYNLARDRLAELETFVEEAKQNGIDVPCSPSVVPGILVADKNDEAGDIAFMAVNRDEQYLRDAAYDFLLAQGDAELIQVAGLSSPEWEAEQAVTSACAPLIVTPDLLDPQRRRRYSGRVVRPGNKHVSASSRATRKTAPPAIDVRTATGKVDYSFVWPIERKNFWLSSFFGPRKKPDGSWGFHYGVDMAACRGTPVHAAAAGVVLEARYMAGYGNCVVVGHSRKYKTRYAHLHAIKVAVGAKVTPDAMIGTVGDTGFVRKNGTDASHLHFEVLAFGKQVNPLPFLRAS